MGKIRFVFALLVGKLAEWALRVLAGRGSNTPGVIMLKLCPDALARFQMPPTVICVTGTNGKTSTYNLVTNILRSAGKTVVNNSKGSNMAPGLVTALAANCTLGGRVKADAAVLELRKYEALVKMCDGKAAKIIIPTDAVSAVSRDVLFSEVTGLGNATVSAEEPPAPAPADPCCDEEDYEEERENDTRA